MESSSHRSNQGIISIAHQVPYQIFYDSADFFRFMSSNQVYANSLNRYGKARRVTLVEITVRDRKKNYIRRWIKMYLFINEDSECW